MNLFKLFQRDRHVCAEFEKLLIVKRKQRKVIIKRLKSIEKQVQSISKRINLPLTSSLDGTVLTICDRGIVVLVVEHAYGDVIKVYRSNSLSEMTCVPSDVAKEVGKLILSYLDMAGYLDEVLVKGKISQDHYCGDELTSTPFEDIDEDGTSEEIVTNDRRKRLSEQSTVRLEAAK